MALLMKTPLLDQGSPLGSGFACAGRIVALQRASCYRAMMVFPRTESATQRLFQEVQTVRLRPKAQNIFSADFPFKIRSVTF